MPAPVPKTAASELLDRIAAAAKRPDISEFELQRFEADAKRLLKVDAAGAHQALGAIASLRFDVEGVKQHHEAAIKLTSDVAARLNYAVSLENVALYSEAAARFLEPVKVEPENLLFLSHAITSHLLAGKIAKAAELVAKYRRLTPDATADKEFDAAESVKTLFEKHEIPESELMQALEIAYDVVRQRRLRLDETSIHVERQNGDESVVYRLYVLAGLKEALAADAELTQKIAETMENIHPSRLAIMIDPARRNESHTAAVA